MKKRTIMKALAAVASCPLCLTTASAQANGRWNYLSPPAPTIAHEAPRSNQRLKEYVQLAQSSQCCEPPSLSGGTDTVHVPIEPASEPPYSGPTMREATPEEQEREEHQHAGENGGSREYGEDAEGEQNEPANEPESEAP